MGSRYGRELPVHQADGQVHASVAAPKGGVESRSAASRDLEILMAAGADIATIEGVKQSRRRGPAGAGWLLPPWRDGHKGRPYNSISSQLV